MRADQVLLSLAFFAFVAFSCGVEIQCNFAIMTFNGYARSYKCKPTFSSLENPTTFTEVSGTHQTGRSHADVIGFFVTGEKTLTKIPNGIEFFFTNLDEFVWTPGMLSSIDSNIFKPFPNIYIIDISDNKLVMLGNDLLEYTPNLKQAYFHRNLLKEVGQDLLTGLDYLKIVDFRFNQCISTRANTSELIQELKIQLQIQCPILDTSSTSMISTTKKPRKCPPDCSIEAGLCMCPVIL